MFEAFAVGLSAAARSVQLARARTIGRLLLQSDFDVCILQSGRGIAARDLLIAPKAPRAMPAGTVWELARAVSGEANVRYAEPLFASSGLEPDPKRLRTLLAPFERAGRAARSKSSGDSKPLPCAAADVLWSIKQINAPIAWALQPPTAGRQFGAGIVIGHPDTGYRPHPEIWDAASADRRVRPAEGYDYVDDDDDPLDPMQGSAPGHGTATASVIMSARPRAQETTVVGVAPAVELVPLRVGDGVVHFSFRKIVQAIYRAVDRSGAHVISISLGGPFHSSSLEAAVDYAIAHGVIVLAAAGNRWPWVVYPARLDQVIAVAACNCLRQPWSGSASGPAVDISAPGESVWRAKSELRGRSAVYSIEASSGTSYAVAHVAGACADWLAFHGRDFLLQKYGSDRLAGVFRAVLTTAGYSRPPGWQVSEFGTGILDLAALLGAPLPPVTRMPKRALFPSRTREEDSLARIASYLPSLAPSETKGILAAAFAPSIRGKKRSQLLDQLGPELAFHVASNARLRERLVTGAHALRRKGRRGSQLAAEALGPIAASASLSLRRHLGG